MKKAQLPRRKNALTFALFAAAIAVGVLKKVLRQMQCPNNGMKEANYQETIQEKQEFCESPPNFLKKTLN